MPEAFISTGTVVKMMFSFVMKNVGAKMITSILVLGILISFSCVSGQCDLGQLQRCAESSANRKTEAFSSRFETVADFFQECQSREELLSCIKTLAKTCLSAEGIAVFEVTTGGQQALFEELCNNASETHKRYMDSFDCIQSIADETEVCQKKFEASQMLIKKELQNDRSKTFYSCCSFEWMKRCKVQIALNSCGEEVSSLIEHMVTTLEGEVKLKLCMNDVGNCYGRLYGVGAGNTVRLDNVFAVCLLLSQVLFWLNQSYRN